MIVVADRGLLSQDKLADLQTITLPRGTPLEFILAVPARRYGEVAPMHAAQFALAKDETLDETRWNDLRLIVAHSPDTAAAQTAARAETMAKLTHQAWVGKLDEQDTVKRYRGRTLPDGSVRATFYRAVCEAHLTRIIQVDLKSEQFTYRIDGQALQQAQLMDGKLRLITNAQDLSPAELAASQDWQSIPSDDGCLRLERQNVYLSSYDRRYFIVSAGVKTVEQFTHAARAHWGVEAMHWVLDVTFRQDDCRVRKGHAARNLSAIRKFVLSALRADTKHPERSLRRRRKLADRHPEYRYELLGIKTPL